MKVGDLILYTPDEYIDADDATAEPPDVGIVLKLTPSGTKASVLWATESVPLYFPVGDLERWPDAFKLLKNSS